MRKSNNFTQPKRQSYVALFYIVWKSYVAIFKQLLPFMVAVGIGSKTNKASKLFWSAIGITILSTFSSIVAFFKFTYHIDGNELIIEKGIFNRKRISIDIDRIQVVNLEQHFLHRIFNVTKLTADTAGSGEEEFVLDAIDMDSAYALRDLVAAYRSKIDKEDEYAESTQTPPNNKTERQTNNLIFLLEPIQLLKAGLVENHLKSSWAIFAFIVYIYFNLQEFDIDLKDYSDKYEVENIVLTFLTQTIIVLIILSILISVIRMVLKYYDLKVYQTSLGIQYTAGLITRRTTNSQFAKIQTLSWSNNKLKQLIGIYDLKLQNATTDDHQEKKIIHIPALGIQHVNKILKAAFPSFEESTLSMAAIEKKWLYRQLVLRPIMPIIGMIIMGILGKYWQMLGFGLFMIIWLYQALARYRKASYGYNDEYVYIKGGIYGDKYTVLPISKVQGVYETDTPYMRRHDLLSVTLQHAAGSITIPYIHRQEARKLQNFLLYRVASRETIWM